MNDFLYKKQVDWSLLRDGFTLPVALHPLLRSRSDLHLDIGEKRPITIVLDGKSFRAQLINSNFDRKKFPGHKEIIQIRYSPQSSIAQYFRQIFAKSFSEISTQKATMGKRLAVTPEIPEFFCLYATDTPNVFAGEAFSTNDLKQEGTLVRDFSEQEWESTINTADPSARIIKLMNKDLKYYMTRFQHLRQARTKYGPAPHKVILLLSIIRGIELKILRENKIAASPIMLCLFKTTWSALVKTDNIPAFALPFFHLKTSKFWHFKAKEGFEEWLNHCNGINSLAQIQRTIQYAYLDGELFLLLASPHSRNILKQVLLEANFPTADWNLLSRKTYFDKVAEEISGKSSENYVADMTRMGDMFDQASFEEERFIRSAVFKKEVSKAYHYSCCISGLRVETTNDCDLLDACHIEPFSISHDDTISNGIYLCPTLHRAFDRYLISIDEDYRLIISKAFVERADSPYSIKQFEGKRIMLPARREHYPSQEKLQKHREKLVC